MRPAWVAVQSYPWTIIPLPSLVKRWDLVCNHYPLTLENCMLLPRQCANGVNTYWAATSKFSQINTVCVTSLPKLSKPQINISGPPNCWALVLKFYTSPVATIRSSMPSVVLTIHTSCQSLLPPSLGWKKYAATIPPHLKVSSSSNSSRHHHNNFHYIVFTMG